ncbi:MAG: hypothetical protein GXO76_03695, partial [Calditrichaeota bacterium]|nr:hypothetical protein [Calditrichota bacterium]
MKKRKTKFFAEVLFLLFWIIQIKLAAANTLTIAVGKQGGYYELVGEAIQKIMQRGENPFKISLVFTQGSQENLRFLEERKVDLALCESNLIESETKKFGRHIFSGVLAIGQEPIQIVVNKERNISGIEGLAGRHVAIGERHGAASFIGKELFNLLEIKDVVLDTTINGMDKAFALKNGKV